jgi:hypothetical protein
LVCFKTLTTCKVCNDKDKGQGVMMLIKTFWLMCGEVKNKLSTMLNIGRMKVNYIDFFYYSSMWYKIAYHWHWFW